MTGKIFNMKRKPNGGRTGHYQSRFDSVLHDPDYGLYVEDYFNDLLRIERKRTERSRHPFILMLMDLTGCQKIIGKDDAVGTIARVLFESTREIDVKGWYKADCVIGVLFTELNGSGDKPEVLKDELLKKIQTRLSKVLDPARLRQIVITCHVYPEEGKAVAATSAGGADLNLYPDLVTPKDTTRKISMMGKRALDIMGSLALITLLSPVLLAVAIAVRLTSKGPVLYRQQRVGRFGKPFTFLKFRSMFVESNAEVHRKYVEEFIKAGGGNGNVTAIGEACFKMKDDPRVTRVGHFIRRTSLDELPQLINVLKGDMSLVGPRPPIPYETAHYDIWHKGRILEVKPGITGLWQVEGRSKTTFDDMVRLDLRYTREWSLWLDVKILFQTPRAVLSCRGAY